MEDRIIRLEEQLAHLDRQVETLDEVVREAFDAIAALRKELDRLRAGTTERIDGIIEAMNEEDEA
jgi:uncharacterized coiled-coil protein SlyX